MTLYGVCVWRVQVGVVNGRLELDESNQSVAVTLSATVPVSCPPCLLTVRLLSPVGLTVSNCSVTFAAGDHSGQTVYVRAVPTAGSNARTTHLQFHSQLYTHVTRSGWDYYTVPPLPVSCTVDTLRIDS